MRNGLGGRRRFAFSAALPALLLAMTVGHAVEPSSQATSAPATQPAAQPAVQVQDFSFLHISDVHVDAHLDRDGEPPAVRGADTIAWLNAEAGKPQEWMPGAAGATPSFGIVTGDLTEYGVIDHTWDLFERAFKDLPCPLYVAVGNHDNTWVAAYAMMRKRHGGENYFFDKFGCHFACISSASPQEPVPTFDAKTRAWLKKDLESIPAGTPVFIAFHHPPYSDEFANPAEVETLMDLLRDHNVALLLYGHGHGVSHRVTEGIDGVMGGSTFGPNSGYGLIDIKSGVLRAAYRRFPAPSKTSDSRPADSQPSTPVVSLVEKKLSTQAPQRLFNIQIERERVAAEDPLVVELAFRDPSDGPAIEKLVFHVDGKETPAVPREAGERQLFELPVAELTPGAHLLTVRVATVDGRSDLRTATFESRATGLRVLWRRRWPAAIKAAPLLMNHLIVVARTDGVVTGVDPASGEEAWNFAAGAEVLGSPARLGLTQTRRGDTLVFGAGDGKVHALNEGGTLLWRFDTGLPVYGSPLIDCDTVYVGDNGGRMHALDVTNGKPRWKFERADFSIECRPAVWNDTVTFGAWDGYLYAVGRADGALKWKSFGPTSSEGKSPRYYAPADCGPLVMGDKLFVCDRGYQLGTFAADGTLQAKLATEVAAIAPAEDGSAFYARRKDDRVAKYSAAGEQLWETEVPAGRFPIPPTERGGKVYVCSNRGLLTALDAGSGKPIWKFQATAGFYVMAPVTVSEQGACYVAGMDGTLTAVRYGP